MKTARLAPFMQKVPQFNLNMAISICIFSTISLDHCGCRCAHLKSLFAGTTIILAVVIAAPLGRNTDDCTDAVVAKQVGLYCVVAGLVGVVGVIVQNFKNVYLNIHFVFLLPLFFFLDETLFPVSFFTYGLATSRTASNFGLYLSMISLKLSSVKFPLILLK